MSAENFSVVAILAMLSNDEIALNHCVSYEKLRAIEELRTPYIDVERGSYLHLDLLL